MEWVTESERERERERERGGKSGTEGNGFIGSGRTDGGRLGQSSSLRDSSKVSGEGGRTEEGD